MNSYVNRKLSDLSNEDRNFVCDFLDKASRSITLAQINAIKHMGCDPKIIFYEPSKKSEVDKIRRLATVISSCASFNVHVYSNDEVAILL